MTGFTSSNGIGVKGPESLLMSNSYEKHCQMLERIFLVFLEDINLPCFDTHLFIMCYVPMMS